MFSAALPLTCFMLQIVTGICLRCLRAFRGRSMEQPADTEITAVSGLVIRALHGWGSISSVAIVLIIWFKFFLFGAYKFS